MIITKKNILIITLISLAILTLGMVSVFAQTSSEVIITWQADNFYPSDYPNKAGVTRGSSVIVGLEIIENGSFANISQDRITWYLDGNLLRREVGADEIDFTVDKLKGDSHSLRVMIERPSGVRDNTISIPVTGYDIALDHSGPSLTVSPNTSLNIRAIPYFFNVSSINNLVFSWNVNNDTRQTEDSNEITLNIGNDERLQGTSIPVNAVIANEGNPLESARTTKTFRIE